MINLLHNLLLPSFACFLSYHSLNFEPKNVILTLQTQFEYSQFFIIQMGNTFPSLSSESPPTWSDYDIIDNNQQDKILYLQCLQTSQQFIGKQLICQTRDEEEKMEQLVSQKKDSNNRYLNKLIKVIKSQKKGICDQQITFYLLFEKPALTLREESVNRKFKFQVFSEEEILMVIESVVKALIFLKKINSPHRRVCTQNILLREDRTIMLSDPWLYPQQYTSIYSLQINGFIYPSPQKILFESDLLDRYDEFLSDYYSLGVVVLELLQQEQMDIIYEKGFRRILENKIVEVVDKVKDVELKEKVRILLNHEPLKRKEIEKYYVVASTQEKFINNEKEKFKKYHIGATLNREDKIEPAKPKISIQQQVTHPSIKKNIDKEFIHTLPYVPMGVKPKIVFVNSSLSKPFQKVMPFSSNLPLQSNLSINTPINAPPSLQKRPPTPKFTQTPIIPISNQSQASFSDWYNPQKKEKQMHKSLYLMLDEQNSKEQSMEQGNKPKQSFESNTVKNSIGEAGFDDIPMSRSNPHINQKLHELNNMIKEAQSINASQEKSEIISEVIGHGFSSKQSSSFGLNSKPENLREIRASLPEPTVKTSVDISFTEQKKRSSIKLDAPAIETATVQLKKNCQATPEQKPSKKRHNSTIKEVSEQSRSFQSYEVQKQVRVIEYDVGTKYIGEIKNDKRDGQGIFYYEDGSFYEGYWKENKMHGKGCLYYASGQLAYEGNWYMDCFHGKGRVYHYSPTPLEQQFNYNNMNAIENYWEVYDGDFFYEKWNGRGKLKLSNGQVYIGDFMQGKVSGEGRYYRLNGQIIAARWSEGYLVKEYQ